jgi:hypothetical protein
VSQREKLEMSIRRCFVVPDWVAMALVMAASAQAQTFSDLYDFGNSSGDPLNPS